MGKSSKVNGLIEDCDEYGEDMTTHEQVNNVIDSDTHLEPKINEIEFDDYETYNYSGQIEEALGDDHTEIDDNQDEVPFRSVEWNVRMDTSTPPHHNGQSQVIVKQTAKRKQHGEEQPNEVHNRDNQEDTEKEEEDGDDEQVEVTSRSVKRSRPTTLSSTKQNTQIITHTLQCLKNCPEMIAKDEFIVHMWEKHSIRPLRCLVKDCTESFNSKRTLGHHLSQSHQSTSQWNCDNCDHNFSSYHGLTVHNRDYHQLGHFQCSFSGCTFTGECRSKVIRHYVQHKQPFKCRHSDCRYETLRAANFKRHKRTCSSRHQALLV